MTLSQWRILKISGILAQIFLGRLSEDRIGLVMSLNCRGINAKYAVGNFALVLSFGEC